MISCIIPARNEQYLQKTIDDILLKAKGQIEIIAVLDGYWPDPPLKQDKRLKIIHRSESLGMRNAINSAASIAQGKYLLKCDAHCCFAEGFDLVLKKDCEPNWTVVPRRYSMDKKNWTRNEGLYFDFQYISHPKDPRYPFKGCDWPEYGARVKGQQICDLMTTQGSCWFMHKDFFEFIGGEDEENYGTMGAEAQEICLKTWLSGGRFVLNRKTWYAHAKKRKSTYGYKKPGDEWAKSRAYAIKCWTHNKWPKQTRELKWLIEKFKPVPGWHTSFESTENNRIIREKFKLNFGTNEYPRVIKGLNRDKLVQLWKELGYKIGAEIGVEKGNFSKLMCEGVPGLKLYLVDPYKVYDGSRKRDRDYSGNLKSAKKLTKGYDVEFLIEPSETAFRKIENNSLDFVYIDGNHRHDYVMLDIILWSRKVRNGGMISGHDFYYGKRSDCTVKPAVLHYINYHNIEPVYLTDTKAVVYKQDKAASWFWIK